MKSYNGFTPAERWRGLAIVKQAIKDGRLKPIEECKCAFCGQDKGIRQYHSEDYTPEKIVDQVTPLCWRCHMMLHSRFRHPKAYERYMDEIKAGKIYPPVYRHDFKVLDENFEKVKEGKNEN